MNRLKNWTLTATGFACVFATSSLHATTDFRITEVYAGLTGEDGTRDWLEITNFGDVAGDTGTLLVENKDPKVSDAKTLPSFTLDPGESAVFLYLSSPSDSATFTDSVTEFEAIWGSIANLGVANEGGIGGGFGQSGDVAYIGFDDGGDFSVIDSFTVDGSFSNSLKTLEDVTGLGNPRESVLGENGAYESTPFLNDNAFLGLPDNEAVLVGSPGVVPEPGSLALLGLGGMAMLARRRNRHHA